MQLVNQQVLPFAQSSLWAALNDVQILQACIPGCESLTQVAENDYELLIMVAVGPVRTRFKGKLRLADLNPPASYTLHFEGQGGIAGHGKGSAQVRLETLGPQQTALHYTAEASVGGKIAQVGARLVDMAAQKMATEFFAAFERELADRQPASAEPLPVAPAAPAPGWFARLLEWCRNLFA